MKKSFAGIDLGGTFIKAGLMFADGKRLAAFKIPTEAGSGVDAVKANLLLAAENLVEISGRHRTRLAGIGVGSPGTVQYPEGKITGSSPNIPGWIGTNIRKLLARFDVPMKGDNDANCMALAEYMFGAGKGTKSGFYITIGTGIGGAVIQNGLLVRGASFAAGEFGHTVMKYNGAKCKCGRKGCVEVYTSAPALIRSAKGAIKKHRKSSLKNSIDILNPRLIFDAFKAGDKAASLAVSKNAEMLGTAVGSVVNLLNPEIVVLGGGMSQGGSEYINLIREEILEFSFASASSRLRIRKAKLGNNAGWIGAACLNISKANN